MDDTALFQILMNGCNINTVNELRSRQLKLELFDTSQVQHDLSLLDLEDYVKDQEKNAEVVFRQHVAGESQEYRFAQQQNYNCTKNTLSFVLSPPNI